MNNPNLPRDIIKDPEQVTNYFSVEISELFRDYPVEAEISAVEKILADYLKSILSNPQSH